MVSTSKFCLLTIRQYSATRKHPFLFPQSDRSGAFKGLDYVQLLFRVFAFKGSVRYLWAYNNFQNIYHTNLPFCHSEQHPSPFLSCLLLLHISSQEIIEANTVLKNNIAGIILMTYTNALTRTISYKLEYFDHIK